MSAARCMRYIVFGSRPLFASVEGLSSLPLLDGGRGWLRPFSWIHPFACVQPGTSVFAALLPGGFCSRCWPKSSISRLFLFPLTETAREGSCFQNPRYFGVWLTFRCYFFITTPRNLLLAFCCILLGRASRAASKSGILGFIRGKAWVFYSSFFFGSWLWVSVLIFCMPGLLACRR